MHSELPLFFPLVKEDRTIRGVFGVAGRRIAEGIVALFALLGFAFVPLGKKTALEHTRDIFTTPAALNAFQEIGAAVARLREKLVETWLSPKSSGSTGETTGSDGPKPEVPRLETKPLGPR